MEDLKAVADLLRSGGFHVQARSEDAYFTIPLHARSQKFTRFQFQGKTYQFTCLPFGSTSAPCTFIKVLKPIADSSLSRRQAHHEQHLPGCPGRHPNPEVHSRESRISDKHGKIHFHPCAGHRILGNPCKLHKHEVSPPRRKSCCNSEGMSPSSKQSSC